MAYNPFPNLFTSFTPIENKPVEYEDIFTGKKSVLDWAEKKFETPYGTSYIVKSNLEDREEPKVYFEMTTPTEIITPIEEINKQNNYSVSKGITGDKKKALEFFINKGLSTYAAAGIVGNLMQESRLKTDAVGDNGSAYGIAQWRLDRRKGLEKFAKDRGTDISDFDTQLEYVWHELNTGYKSTLDKLLSSNDVDQATSVFMQHYERPNPKYANLTARIKNASSLLN